MGQESCARKERRIVRGVMADFPDGSEMRDQYITITHTMERHFRRAVQLVTDVNMMHPNPSNGFNRAQRRMIARARREELAMARRELEAALR